MATIGSLVIKLSADATALTAGFKQAGSVLRTFERQLMSVKSALIGFASSFTGVAVGGGAVAAVGGFLAYSVKVASEEFTAQKQLAATLQTTGGAAGYSAQQLIEYAASLQKTTNFADDATVSAMALLATFDQIRGPAFKDTIKLAQDLATVFGIDLNSAVLRLGAVFTDPEKGLDRLRRAGIVFTAGQIEQVKALQDTGNMLGAQRMAYDLLANKVGGAAEKMADPFKQLKNAIEDTAEAIGLDMLPALKEVAKSLKELMATGQGTGAGAFLGGVIDELERLWYYLLEIKYAWDWAFGKSIDDNDMKQRYLDLKDMADTLQVPWSERHAAGMAARMKMPGVAAFAPADLETGIDKVAMKASEDHWRRLGELMNSLDREVATFGKSEGWKKLFDLEAMGVRPGSSMYEMAKKMIEQIDAMKKAQDEWKKTLEETGKVLEDTLTPMEKYFKVGEDIQRLLDVGAIGPETARRAMLKAGSEYTSAFGPPQMAGAAGLGTAEGAKAILQAMSGIQKRDVQEDIRNLTEEQLAEIRRMVALLEENKTQREIGLANLTQ
jgi:hypothetical protein